VHTPSPPKPFYVHSAGSTAGFAVYHPPAAELAVPKKPAVLFSPPWGWDDVASYRVRREWAGRLAAAGFPTLRFDLPGTGNSAGSVDDSKLTLEWVTAVASSATWLAETTEASGVATLGFGLGGLLALLAVMAGAPIAALALWGTPGGGRRFIRETKAFSQMQAWHDEAGGDFDPAVREGWLEAGGFTLSPETLRELNALKPAPGTRMPLRRALLLDRDGVAIDPKLASAVELSGAEVTSAPGIGWGAMVSHPEQAELPRAVADVFQGWLLEEPSAVEPPPPPARPVKAVESIELGEGASAFRE
jgi:pimeloyl-ACP methyl ester carboxylesterase